jgi:hypothetical protein
MGKPIYCSISLLSECLEGWAVGPIMNDNHEVVTILLSKCIHCIDIIVLYFVGGLGCGGMGAIVLDVHVYG